MHLSVEGSVGFKPLELKVSCGRTVAHCRCLDLRLILRSVPWVFLDLWPNKHACLRCPQSWLVLQPRERNQSVGFGLLTWCIRNATLDLDTKWATTEQAGLASLEMSKQVREAPTPISVPEDARATVDELRAHLSSCDAAGRCSHCYCAAGRGSKIVGIIKHCNLIQALSSTSYFAG